MKKVFALMMVLTMAVMLMAGCTAPLSPQHQESPSPAFSPEQSPSGTAPSPEQTTSSPASSGEQTTDTPSQIPATPTQSPEPSTGKIAVLITDAPKHDVSKVELKVSRVEVHKAGTGEGPGKWMTLDVQEETFNLLDYQNGLTMLLADGEIEAGKYTQLRMTVFEVIVDYDDILGKQAEVPSNEIKFVRPFTLEGGKSITLVVDVDAAKSVIVTGGAKQEDARVLFKPVIKLQVINAGENEEGGEGENEDGEGEQTEQEPELVSLSPADNATGVAPGASLVLTFNENMETGTGNVTINRYSDNSTFEEIDVASALVSISGTEVTIDPSGTLENGTGYYILIDEGAFIDNDGDSYAGISDKDTWNFTTAEAVPLTIEGSSLAPDNSYIDIEFSEGVYGDAAGTLPLEAADLNLIFNQNGGNASDVSISSVNATSGGALTGSESTVRINLNVTGTPEGVETVEIKPQDSSIYNATGDSAAITETTGAVALNDRLAPSVLSFSPADNATGVAQDANLVLSFNDIMAAGTGNITIKSYSDNTVFEAIDISSASVNISGTQVTIDPAGTFEPATGYYVIIDETALVDDGGNSYAGILDKEIWNFTT